MDATNPVQPTARPDRAPADYDEPYRFGRRPTVRAPYPFTERQFAKLLILRGKVFDAPPADDLLAA
jgi:hypothetical protein